MAKKFTVGVDVDGVLADFTFSARELLKKLYGKPDDNEIQTGWGFDSLGINQEEEDRMWSIVNETPNWWVFLKRMANSNLLPVLESEHSVIYITKRRPEAAGIPVEEQTALWLLNLYGVQMPTVLLSRDKGPLAKALKLDYFIDDKPENLQLSRNILPKTKVYLYDASYNQEFDGAPRVRHFDQYAQEILNAGRS